MKEVRIEDAEGPLGQAGINIAIRCCGGKFQAGNGIVLNPSQSCFVPADQDDCIYFCCLQCGQFCRASTRDGFYCIDLPGLEIVYNGQEICVYGNCDCQNCYLRDVYTNNTSEGHCVDSHLEGEYEFKCPCGRTYIVIVRGKDKHFHVLTEGECPVLTSKQRKQENWMTI